MRLLQKASRQYFVYSIIIILLTIPIFYFTIMGIVKEDMEEELRATRAQVASKLEQLAPGDKVNFWIPNLEIIEIGPAPLKDSLYTIHIIDTLTRENVPYRVLATNVIAKGRYFNLHIRTSLVDYNFLIQGILIVLTILLVLLFIGLQWINWRLNRRLWKPFYNTLESVKRYNIEDHTKLHLPTTGIKEMDDLNHNLRQLTERNYQSYTSQKEFAENAAHELQTPLAIIQGKLELLMQTSPLTERQAVLIDESADAVRRMVRLNKSLVLLTKIDNNLFTQVEEVPCNQIVDQFMDQYREQLAKKHLHLTIRHTGNLNVIANKALIEILINNLIVNAIRHSTENGILETTVSADAIQVKNSGNAPLDIQRLLGRFQKVNQDAKSTGLGLEIVSKICHLYHFNLSYEFVEGYHIFSIMMLQ
ncbi:hypothetical protein COR50_14495 [Chitinophaga caeni]|uniref:histidine kinase n=1 Tax=Chitinophaga caeni TaxID=2029983 RepID=A0A291QWD4_9BACT|nr:HAMP domain-containing sensor histidine kinase [Chitinophaga caeni]ATL48276.1 hypothetical protein COR50_14495 [Chitinophaga caeni]